MSRILINLVLAGIWGEVRSTHNTQNINTSIRAQAERAIIKPFEWFILLQHIHAYTFNLALVRKINLLSKAHSSQEYNPGFTKNLNQQLPLTIVFKLLFISLIIFQTTNNCLVNKMSKWWSAT